MAIEVVLPHTTPDQMLAIVRELKAQGLLVNRDFDFRYEPPSYDNDGWSQVTPKQCVFKFTQEKHATLFILKYGR
jgi:hypothetical protein